MLALLLRVAVSAGLIALLAWRLGVENVSQRFGSLDASWTALAFLTVFAAIALSAWKWGLILRARGYLLGYPRLIRHYFVGLVFNNVLPTTVGGDAVRAWETTKDTSEYPEAIGSVVTERLIAGVALGVTALLGLPFVASDSRIAWFAVLFLVIDIALVALFLVPKVAEGAVGVLVPRRMAGFHAAVRDTVAVVRASLRNRALFLGVALASVLFQVLVAIVNACVFHALGVPVPLAYCVIFTPMIFTVTMLPISVSGLGVREVAYAYFFSQVGVGGADAVAASLAFFLIVGLASLPGAVMFTFRSSSFNRAVPP
jgi:glycosyltransferase 2 family protein